MQELSTPFKRDKKNLWYLDTRDVKLTPFKFIEIGKSYSEKREFFYIEGVNDYIVKDTTMYPLLFNRTKTMSILKHFSDKQDLLLDIDFPIGYCKDAVRLKGTIIPYYQDSISLCKIIYLHKLSELKNYYNHESDVIDNLISLCLSILDLIIKMYDQNISYLDIHSGNFLIYNNTVKVIDFEPSFVYFKNRYKHYDRIIKNYTMLVERICRRFGFEEVLLYPAQTFIDTELRVKSLKKELER